METVKRTERGWAGHFIQSDRCSFRRNTLLEYGDQRIVVSTVGALRNPLVDGDAYEEVGCGRYYETMAFVAKCGAGYWDADIDQQVHFDSPWTVCSISPETDQKANGMHEQVVEEICQKLISSSLQLDE